MFVFEINQNYVDILIEEKLKVGLSLMDQKCQATMSLHDKASPAGGAWLLVQTFTYGCLILISVLLRIPITIRSLVIFIVVIRGSSTFQPSSHPSISIRSR